MVRQLLPERPPEAHKGTFGTALVVAGSVNYTGAALLAGKAAYRVGAGLVTLAVPESLQAALAGHFPEATWLPLPEEMGVIAGEAAQVVWDNLERPTALLIGPGFGLEEPTRRVLARLLDRTAPPHRSQIGFIRTERGADTQELLQLPPLVIDADGLKLLAKLPDWAEKLPGVAVLTPHPGEMAILSGLEVAEIQADRLGVAERFAGQWDHVVVLKGAYTVIASPDGRSRVIPVATAALARAGTGDVLAGLIAGLRAQGVEAYEAASAGCWIHAQCGLVAKRKTGSTASVLAGDVLEAVSPVMASLER
jgi:NAD(P)H-hydrate epimerase